MLLSLLPPADYRVEAVQSAVARYTRIGFEATTEINRKDFGIDFNIPLDGGKFLVGDKVNITLAVEAVLNQA